MTKLTVLIAALAILSLSCVAQSFNEIVDGNTQFTFDLYTNLRKSNKDGNLFFSPHSISEVMAITQLGARNKTAQEIASVMHFKSSKNSLHTNFNALHKQLGKNLDSVILKSANSLWAQKGYVFKQEFINDANTYYNAPCSYLNFKKKGSRKKALAQINNWTLKNTNKQIDNFLSTNDLNKETRLVLVNAIWFNGNWANSFNEKQTKKGVFHSIKGEQHANYMQKEAKYWYYDDDMIQALRMPYNGNKQSMIIFLPTNSKDFSKFEDNFDDYYIRNILKDLREVKIKVRIPKFESEFTIDLAETLKSLGMEQAFNDNADFSGMTEKNDLKIDKIIHKAKIEVNEKGSKAAAATAVTMMRKTAVIDPLEFNADHPFVYLIRDEHTGSILFMGRLSSFE